MSTRDEIEQAINDLADNAHAIGWNHRHADKTQPSVDHVMALIDAALTAPPAPGEVRFCPHLIASEAEMLEYLLDIVQPLIHSEEPHVERFRRELLTECRGFRLAAAAAPEQSR